MGIVEPLQDPLAKRRISFEFEANEEVERLESCEMTTCIDSIDTLKNEEGHRHPTLEPLLLPDQWGIRSQKSERSIWTVLCDIRESEKNRSRQDEVC